MDSFLIVSPWRSGSTLTAVMLSQYLSIKYKEHNSIIGVENTTIQNFTPKSVYHSHNVYNIKLAPESCVLIRNKRDLVDCAISTLVAKKLQIWTHFNHQEVSKDIDLTISLSDFDVEMKKLYIWEKAADAVFENYAYFTVEYNSIKNDPNNVFKILNMDFHINMNKDIPTKVNLDYKRDIPNYLDLIEHAVNQGWRSPYFKHGGWRRG